MRDIDFVDLRNVETQAGSVDTAGHIKGEIHSDFAGGPLQLDERDDHAASGTNPKDVIETLVELGRLRRRWLKTKVGLELQAQAICRSHLGGAKEPGNDEDSARAEKVKKEAAAMFKAARKGDADPVLLVALVPYIAALDNFESQLSNIDKPMRRHAKSLSIWEFVQTVPGFGDGNLAYLLAETGDLSNYSTVSKLWKRLGLAVFDGERQRKHADKDKAIRDGYSPARRAVAWNLGACLLRTGEKNIYRQVYLDRKEYLAARSPDWTKAHIHNDASRYMTKRVLRDLWATWNRTAIRTVEPIRGVPSETDTEARAGMS